MRKFLRLSRQEKKAYAKCAFLLARAWFQIHCQRFEKLSQCFGVQHQQTSEYPISHEQIRKIKLMVRRMARYCPFPAKCLSQAIVAQTFLNQYQLPSTLYLGVAKDKKKKLKAHAWLRCGNVIVTGAKGMQAFTVVSTFAKEFGDA